MAVFNGDNLDIILGQEFLTWLWYRSEYADGLFKMSPESGHDGENFHVKLEQKLVVRGGEGDYQETASVSGSFSPMREARLGLSTGKKVVSALIRISKDELDWQVALKAEDFCLNSLRTPPIAKLEEGDDPDNVFYEKIYLIEMALTLLDDIYRQFLNIRLSPMAWAEEVKSISTWINLDLTVNL